MDLEISVQYQCRQSNYIANITEEIGDDEKIYRYKGYVFDANTGATIRALCMWTSSGNYAIDHTSDFDVLTAT